MVRRARPIHRPVRLAVLLWLLAGAADAEPADPIRAGSAAEILAALAPAVAARLQEEKVVILEPAVGAQDARSDVHALVLFERPRNEVLRYLIQTARQREFRPELRRVEKVEESERSQVVEYEIQMMLMRVRYRTRHAWDFRTGRTWWSLDPEFDNDLAKMEGRWELFEMESGRSLGRLDTRLDVGHALPAFLQDLATRRKLPESMQRLRRWVDSGGTYRP